MVKIRIRRVVRKTKKIKLIKNKKVIFRRRPIVLYYIPSKKRDNWSIEQYLKEFGVNLNDKQRDLLSKLTKDQKEEVIRRIEELIKKKGKISPEEISNIIFDVLKKGEGNKKVVYVPAGGIPGIGMPYPPPPYEGEYGGGLKRRVRIEGLPFPHIKSEVKTIEKIIKKEDLHDINIKYPLIPKKPERGEEIFAYAHIYWDNNANELRYDVVEPELLEKEKHIIEMLKEYIREKIDIDFAAVKKFEARNYIFKKIDEALEYFKLDLPQDLVKIIRYYIYRDFLGFEKIEPLLQDDDIEDISCDGINIPIYIVHRDPRFGSMKTNVVFDSKEQLDSFVIKLAQRCDRDISVAHPLLDGILPDNSRVQATLATDIARRGSNFTIRKFSKDPFTPTRHILYNTCDTKLMAYIWFALENGRSILISGGTGSGKTSLLNSISILLNPREKIVSIEDTGELQLPHLNWVPEVARESMSVPGKSSVTLFDLLKESLRQRPDRIIVGEVRGKEAFVLFQAMATGHPGLATIHAESIETLIDRLITEPINLPSTLLEILDVIIFISRVKVGNKILRRISEIDEIAGMDYKTKRPIINTFAKWDPKTDEFKIKGKSVVLKKVVERTGMKKEDMEEDIRNKTKVLEWLTENRIVDYKLVGKYLAQYNVNPKKFLERIGK